MYTDFTELPKPLFALVESYPLNLSIKSFTSINVICIFAVCSGQTEETVSMLACLANKTKLTVSVTPSLISASQKKLDMQKLQVKVTFIVISTT